MATQKNGGSKKNSVDAGQDIPADAPAETTLAAPAGEEMMAEATPAPAREPEPVAEVADIVSTPLAVIEAVETATEGFAAAFSFDSSLWTKKYIELWAENAAAFLEFAQRTAKAQTLDEVVDLQSRFANERFEALLRQSKELMDFTKNVASLSAAPLCDVRKAA